MQWSIAIFFLGTLVQVTRMKLVRLFWGSKPLIWFYPFIVFLVTLFLSFPWILLLWSYSDSLFAQALILSGIFLQEDEDSRDDKGDIYWKVYWKIGTPILLLIYRLYLSDLISLILVMIFIYACYYRTILEWMNQSGKNILSLIEKL